MTRRAAFLTVIALGAVLAGAPMTAMAQQPAKVFRIGILSPAAAASTKGFDALRNGLRELGYTEGLNIEIEYRLAAWDYGRLPAMAADLVRLPVDVIVTDTREAARTAQEATRTIPIVAATAGADRWRPVSRRASRIRAPTLPALPGRAPSSAASGCSSSKTLFREFRASRRCRFRQCPGRPSRRPRRRPAPSG